MLNDQFSSAVAFKHDLLGRNCSGVGSPICVPPRASRLWSWNPSRPLLGGDAAGNAASALQRDCRPGNVPPFPVFKFPIVNFPAYTIRHISTENNEATLVFDASNSYDWMTPTSIISGMDGTRCFHDALVTPAVSLGRMIT